MQMHLPMTAFISQGWTKATAFNSVGVETENRWTIRWFTTVNEGELCGHATLASANVIFNQIYKNQGHGCGDKVIFETKYKGNLEAVMDWPTGHIALNFPSNPPAPLTNAGPWLEKVVAGIITSRIPRALIEEVLMPPQ